MFTSKAMKRRGPTIIKIKDFINSGGISRFYQSILMFSQSIGKVPDKLKLIILFI